MRQTFYILCLLLFLVGCNTTRNVTNSITTEEEVDTRFKYYFYQAQLCLSQQRYDQAMALLLFCQQLNSQDAATQHALGYMYHAVSQTENALQHYKAAFLNDPQMYWSSYASLLYQTNQLEQAAQVLEHVTSLSPNNIDALEALSAVYTTQHKISKALIIQDKIEALEGINSYNTITRYRLLLTQGKTDKAIQVINRYLDNNPYELRFRVFQADLYLAQGKEQEAIKLYKQELEKNPDNPYVFISLSNYCASKQDLRQAALYMQQAILSNQLDLSQKLQLLQDTGAEKLDYIKGLTEQTLLQLTYTYPLEEAIHTVLARYYISHADYSKALPVLHTMLDINPNNPNTWQTTLQVLQADTNTTNNEFEKLIRQAYYHFPNDPQWAFWMARVHIVNHNTDSALNVVRAGVQQHGDVRYRIELQVLEGDICNMLGDMEGTYNAYEKVLEMNPNNAYVLNNYAYMLATHGGDLKKAEQMSRKTIEAEPDNATYLDTYAWILHLQQQDFLAGYYIEKALENMQDNETEEIIEHYIEITGKQPK